MNIKAYTAFILGLAAGVINMLFAATATLGELPKTDTGAIVCVAADVLCLINFTGACICKARRIAGGALMAASAAVMLAAFILCGAGAVLASFAPEAAVAFIVTELVSVTAAVLCFTPAPKRQSEFFYERTYERPASPPPEQDKKMGGLVRSLYGEQPKEAPGPDDRAEK
jgi:hypothetical protein